MSENEYVMLGRLRNKAEQIAADLEQFGGDKAFITVFSNGYFDVSVSRPGGEAVSISHFGKVEETSNPYQE